MGVKSKLKSKCSPRLEVNRGVVTSVHTKHNIMAQKQTMIRSRFIFRLLGGLLLQKRRHWAIERVGYGAEQLGFHFLDDAVGRDHLRARIEHRLLNLWCGLI